MKTLDTQRPIVAVVLVLFVLAVAGCSMTPSLQNVEAVSLQTHSSADFSLHLMNEASPSDRPGTAAGEGASTAFDECINEGGFLGVISSPLCAAAGAAVGATVGAVATTITTIPDEDAAALNNIADSVSASRDWELKYRAEFENQARHNKATITDENGTTSIEVDLVDLGWKVSAGNQVSLRASISTVTIHHGKRYVNRYAHESPQLGVDQWVADDGGLISLELDSLLENLSSKMWDDFNR